MEDVLYYCVYCGEKHSAPAADAGREVPCARCTRRIIIPAPTEPGRMDGAGPATLPMAQARILQMEAQIEKLRNERDRAKQEARRAVDEVASLQARIGELQRSTESAKMARALTERKLADARSRAERLETQLLDAQARAREIALELRRARTEIHRLRYTFSGGSNASE